MLQKKKHVPEVSRDGDVVNVVVGSVEHPMEEKHYITNIFAVRRQSTNRLLKTG